MVYVVEVRGHVTTYQTEISDFQIEIWRNRSIRFHSIVITAVFFQLDMRIHDNALARKLLEKRQEFLEVKAVKTCDQHASMIDDYSWQLEQEDDIADLLRCEKFPITCRKCTNIKINIFYSVWSAEFIGEIVENSPQINITTETNGNQPNDVRFEAIFCNLSEQIRSKKHPNQMEMFIFYISKILGHTFRWSYSLDYALCQPFRFVQKYIKHNCPYFRIASTSTLG